MEYGPSKTAKQVSKPPPIGYYSAEKEELDWQRCREQFSKNFVAKTNGFFFSYEAEKCDGITSFIYKAEGIVSESSREKIEPSKFSKSNLNFALWVEPSKFWKACEMRRSLFTILLRCGMNYRPADENFEEALYSNGYIKKTKDATHRFFFGFTRYVDKGETISGIGKGWVNSFGQIQPSVIRGRLLPPKGTEEEVCLVGAGSLWT